MIYVLDSPEIECFTMRNRTCCHDCHSYTVLNVCSSGWRHCAWQPAMIVCASGNGTIEFNEFLAMMNRTVKHVNVEQEMRQAFKGDFTHFRVYRWHLLFHFKLVLSILCDDFYLSCQVIDWVLYIKICILFWSIPLPFKKINSFPTQNVSYLTT